MAKVTGDPMRDERSLDGRANSRSSPSSRVAVLTEERLHLIAEHSRDVVMQMDFDGTIVWVSPSAEAILGWDVEAVAGTKSLGWMHPEDLVRFAEAEARARESGEQTRMMFRVRRGGGDYMWVESGGAEVPAHDGQQAFRVVRLRDVDAQVRAQQRLEESEALLRAVTAVSPVGMFLMNAASGTITMVNDAACSLLGRERGELLGRAWAETEDAQEATSDAAAINEIRAGTRDSLRGQRRLTRPDGATVWIDLSAAPVRNDADEVTHVITQLLDITGTVEAHERLVESERQYRLLADNSVDIVVLTDTVGTLEYVSPAVHAVLGWQPDELVGVHMADLLHPADVAELEKIPEILVKGATSTTSGRARLQCKDGSYKWADSVAKVLYAADSHSVGVVASWRDAEETVMAEQALADERRLLEAVLDSELEPHVYLQAVRDDDGAIVDFIYADANRAACEYLGMPVEEIEGATVLDLLPGQAGSGMLALYSNAVESGEPLELNNYAYDHEILGSERRYDIRAGKVGDGLSFAWRDVTERYQAEVELKRLAETDSLTGLLSRATVLDKLDAIQAHPARTGTNTAVLFCDLDDLKSVNDTWGHAVGDQLISASAARIINRLRSDDVVARFGGDEMLIVLTNVGDMHDLETVAEGLRSALAEPIATRPGVPDLCCTVSIGATLLRPDDDTDTIVNRADEAMYAAKAGGRNRVVVVP